MMKLMFVLVSIILLTLFTGCGTRLDEKGDLAEYRSLGKFRGITFYKIQVESGMWVVVGIKEGEVASTTVNGKVPLHSVFINGKSVSIQEAKELLNHE